MRVKRNLYKISGSKPDELSIHSSGSGYNDAVGSFEHGNKNEAYFWPGVWLWASQEGLYSMELVNFKDQCEKLYQKSHPKNTAMPGHVYYKPWLGVELTIVL